MAQPFQAFVGAYNAAGQTTQSNFLTFSFANTANFDAYVPIVIVNGNTTGISAGGEVTVYRSTDGGLTYETEGNVQQAFSRPTTALQLQRRALRLKPGQYLIGICPGGGNANITFSIMQQTAYVITAYA